MTPSILALYLSHVEASFAFDDPVITGAVFEEYSIFELCTPPTCSVGVRLWL